MKLVSLVIFFGLIFVDGVSYLEAAKSLNNKLSGKMQNQQRTQPLIFTSKLDLLYFVFLLDLRLLNLVIVICFS